MAAIGSLNPAGLFDTSFNPTELNTQSFSDTILRLWPNGTAPVYGMTGKVRKGKKAVSSTHGYFTKHFAISTFTMNGALLAGATTFVGAANATVGIIPGMCFQVPTTREIVRVLSITNSTTMECERSFGRVAAGAVGAADVLTPVGNAHEEASTRPTSRSMDSTYVPNYTVIVRNSWSITGTASASQANAGYNNLAETKADCMAFHSTDNEVNLLFGQAVAPTTDATSGNIIHATQGIVDSIYEFASGNVNTAGATTTESQLEDLVAPAFTQMSSPTAQDGKRRLCLVDRLGYKVINDIGKASAQITMTTETTTFGMRFTRFRTLDGELDIIQHPLFADIIPASDTGFALIVDINTISFAYMEGRDVVTEDYNGIKDSTGTAIDARGGSLLSEYAVESKAPVTCAIINGLTAAA